MYTGFNAKKQRKQTRIETLQAENEKLRRSLTTLIHIHERLKNERTQVAKTQELSSLPEGTVPNGGAIVLPCGEVPEGTNREPTAGKDQKGA